VHSPQRATRSWRVLSFLETAHLKSENGTLEVERRPYPVTKSVIVNNFDAPLSLES